MREHRCTHVHCASPFSSKVHSEWKGHFLVEHGSSVWEGKKEFDETELKNCSLDIRAWLRRTEEQYLNMNWE